MRTNNRFAIKWRVLSSLLIAGGMVAGCNLGPKNNATDSNQTINSNLTVDGFEASTCFWKGPYVIEIPEAAAAFADTGAAYWSAKYTQPEGVTLKIKGDFPHARYISINSYQPTISDATHAEYPGGTPRFAVADRDMAPDLDSINPFLQDADRNSEYRSYTLEVVPTAAPDLEADWAENTVYEESVDGIDTVLVYRVYVPDTDTGLTGGVALPEVELTLNGEVYTGEAACEQMNVADEYVQIPFVPAGLYTNLVALSAYKAGAAQNPPRWYNARGFNYLLSCDYLSPAALDSAGGKGLLKAILGGAGITTAYTGDPINDFIDNTAGATLFAGPYVCPAEKVRDVGFYANLDNQYLYTHLDRGIKEIAVTRGKMPNVPATYDGGATFDLSTAEVRYWSICQNEFYSQIVTSCLYDEQVVLDDQDNYTIVTSLPEDRPSNATEECGVGYLEWSAKGDGFDFWHTYRDIENTFVNADGTAFNNDDSGFLILRNMLPENGFTETAQAIPRLGDEAITMGDHMPVTTYYTKAEFEALGCSF